MEAVFKKHLFIFDNLSFIKIEYESNNRFELDRLVAVKAII